MFLRMVVNKFDCRGSYQALLATAVAMPATTPHTAIWTDCEQFARRQSHAEICMASGRSLVRAKCLCMFGHWRCAGISAFIRRPFGTRFRSTATAAINFFKHLSCTSTFDVKLPAASCGVGVRLGARVSFGAQSIRAWVYQCGVLVIAWSYIAAIDFRTSV